MVQLVDLARCVCFDSV
ncbi:hypothetical protein OF865_00580 [Escherichia coli]|nr:hypothetical protein OF865_00580 [Escherichia coli]